VLSQAQNLAVIIGKTLARQLAGTGPAQRGNTPGKSGNRRRLEQCLQRQFKRKLIADTRDNLDRKQ
jgi:hypothetical protein